ncbi:MAG: hypothetical protein PWP46_1213 [Fusobacteriaceae bacterium]|jgi:NAD(P)H dehydrogenase (quinone)|nr:flavodoxin/nitric oxide synthase [Fusobacteriales bacterium]MDN5304329.1 hypothetical protein [Fusobacteriaceae bacterium]
MEISEVDKDFVNSSNAVILGTPTYYANMSWQMKKWFDESVDIKLSGKIGAVFATENHIGGGADTALLTLINHMLVKGMLIYSGGAALGNPYIHLGIVAIKNGDEYQKERAKIFGERIANKIVELFGNKN